MNLGCQDSEGHRGTVEANVYQKTVDYPTQLSNGYHIIFDTDELVTLRWVQVTQGR